MLREGAVRSWDTQLLLKMLLSCKATDISISETLLPKTALGKNIFMKSVQLQILPKLLQDVNTPYNMCTQGVAEVAGEWNEHVYTGRC
jgi:hypothetical protein